MCVCIHVFIFECVCVCVDVCVHMIIIHICVHKDRPTDPHTQTHACAYTHKHTFAHRRVYTSSCRINSNFSSTSRRTWNQCKGMGDSSQSLWGHFSSLICGLLQQQQQLLVWIFHFRIEGVRWSSRRRFQFCNFASGLIVF